MLAFVALTNQTIAIKKPVKKCLPGLIPARGFNGDHCSCGAYPSIPCFYWNWTNPDCKKHWVTCGDISALVGRNVTFNSFGIGVFNSVSMLAKYDVTELNDREGILLTRCKGNKSLSLFDGVTCVDCSSPNPVGAVLLYLLLNSIPIVVLFTVVVFFNINLASGLGHSFLFFYQVAPLILVPMRLTLPQYFSNVYTASFLWDFFRLHNTLMDIVNTTSFPCLSHGPNLLALSALMYLKVGIAIVMIVMTVILVNCHCCSGWKVGIGWSRCRRWMRHGREKYAIRGTLLTGLCSASLLAVGSVLETASFLLTQSYVYYFPATSSDGLLSPDDLLRVSVPILNGENRYLTKSHVYYSVFAFFSLLVVVLFSLILLYKPAIPMLFHKFTRKSLPSLSKLDPIFDVFQEAYKPKYRFFAGVYLLYRIFLWCCYLFITGTTNYQFGLLFTLIIILAIHCIFQPFRVNRQNFLETLFLLNLTIIAALLHFKEILAERRIDGGYVNTVWIILSKIVSISLLVFPLLIVTIYVLYRRCKPFFVYCKRRCAGALLEENEQLIESVNILEENIQ